MPIVPFPALALLLGMLGSTAAFAGESDFYASDDCEEGLLYVLEDGVVQTVLIGTYDDTSDCAADEIEYRRDYDGDGYSTDLYCCFEGADTWPEGTYTYVPVVSGFSDPDEVDRGDCDDDDENAYPDAPEVCDGALNDCPLDGSSTDAPDDEVDDDGDGYVDCEVWVGDDEGVLGGDDCDDEDESVYPGAEEICDGLQNDCDSDDGVPEDEVDDDGDGYVDCDDWEGEDEDVLGALDCDDEDESVYPGAEEICDGKLNDCDEDELSTDETDEDGDGYAACDDWAGDASLAGGDCDDEDADTAPGAAAQEPDLCAKDSDGDGYGDSAAEGEVDAGTDCDDDDAEVHPDQDEVCEDGDQVDTDCDGSVNTSGCDGEDCALVSDGVITAYEDADGDGYASTEATELIEVCERIDGYSESRTDCDDTDAGVNIDATESCEDDTDNDCDGEIDEQDASGCKTMYRDIDGDGYGDYDESACLCADDDGDGSLDGEVYVAQGGDCYDGDAQSHPVSCEDGLDNDGDGLTDALDPDCEEEPGLSEDGLSREDALERLDGHDNDCDGDIPAIELDCDEDGALPALPLLASAVSSADDVGLTSCGDPDASATITCWDLELTLSCDLDEDGEGSGLWILDYDASDDGYEGRFDGGERVYEEGDITVISDDCDDLCALRSPAFTESCDGLDDDCSGTEGADQDGDGLPDALQTDDEPVAGLVSALEIDLDQDGYLPCADFTGDEEEVYETDASCADVVTEESALSDCENRCSLSYSAASERCDGFTNDCDGDAEVTDEDGDGYGTCGAWGVDGADDGEEDIYILAWMRQDGSNSGYTDDTDDTGDTGDADDTGDTGASSDAVLADIVPLILPRADAPDCDAPLLGQLSVLVGPDTLSESLDAGDPTVLLAACSAQGGTCGVVRLTLSPEVDEETEETWIDEAVELGFANPSCLAHPEQRATRTVWSRERILAARHLVLEWECQRQFGKGCAEADAEPELIDGWDEMADASDALSSAAWWWWMEIDRYGPEAITGGTVGECWGEPVDFDPETQPTGGDCADGSSSTSRDQAEGPWDVVGLYAGEEISCDTCTDGLDNNCDGNTDCADPACAPCFVGQGFGCGGDDETSCSAVGCTVASAREAGRGLALLLVALAALGRRRLTARRG